MRPTTLSGATTTAKNDAPTPNVSTGANQPGIPIIDAMSSSGLALVARPLPSTTTCVYAAITYSRPTVTALHTMTPGVAKEGLLDPRPGASADENPTNPRIPSTIPEATPCSGTSSSKNCDGSQAREPAHTNARINSTKIIVTDTSSSVSETRADKRMPRIVNSVARPPSTTARAICGATPETGTPTSTRNCWK